MPPPRISARTMALPKQITILAIESTTDTISVAIQKAEKLVTTTTHHHARKGYYHLPLIKEVCQKAQTPITTIDAIAISKGPGSYTGLRQTTALAKGIAFARNIPIIAINTLLYIADLARRQNPHLQGHWCSILDARRGAGYALILDANGHCVEDTTVVHAEQGLPERWQAYPHIYFVGDGAENNPKFIPANGMLLSGYKPQAQGLAPLAYQAWQKRAFADLATFEPTYLSARQGWGNHHATHIATQIP